jgi:hypothetical protein
MPTPLSSAAQLAGYPQGVGDRFHSVVDHKGPTSYATLVTGNPPTGGDTLTAIECGLRFISAVIGGLSDDGQFRCEGTVGAAGQAEAAQAKLIWTVAATGAQVANTTNLSARSARLMVIGR